MWEPVSREGIESLISGEIRELSAEESRFFEAIRVELVKWQLKPWGDEGGGFWVVAKTSNQVLWYNDIEDGFNTSSYAIEGIIGEYWCNQDSLQSALRSLNVQTVKLGKPRPLP